MGGGEAASTCTTGQTAVGMQAAAACRPETTLNKPNKSQTTEHAGCSAPAALKVTVREGGMDGISSTSRDTYNTLWGTCLAQVRHGDDGGCREWRWGMGQ